MPPSVKNFLVTRGVDFVLQLAAAIAIYVIGRWVIWGIRGLLRRALDHRHLDPTLAKYIDQTIGVVLTILLIIGALGVMGVQTTSLAGLLAAAGVAVGVALSGLLANIAAGMFMVALRPFKKGDTVQVAGVQGEVESIGLFGTSLMTPDGARVVIGNARALGDNIHNFTGGSHRRVEARVQLPWACDPTAFHDAVRARLAADPRVLASPAPMIDVIEHSATGPVSVIRPSCAAADYAEILALTHRIIGEEIRNAGIAAPTPAAAPAPLVR